MDGDDAAQSTDEEWVKIDDPSVKKLIQRYMKRRKEDLEKLKSFALLSDFDNIRRLGHNLTGSGTAYGLDRISEIGNALLDAAIAEDAASVRTNIESLENYINKLRIM